MKSCNAPEKRTTRGILPIACAAALAVAFMISPPHAAHANKVAPVIPPPMPANIQVPAGNTAYLEGHAVGTQIYVCLPSSGTYVWSLVAPQATLFNDYDRQVIAHFRSPALQTFLDAWQHSEDTSTVWGIPMASSTDPAYVVPGAVPWLLVKVLLAQNGPTGGHALTATTFIQRVTTSGGDPPATGCSQLTDVGDRAFVPYSADYFFYR